MKFEDLPIWKKARILSQYVFQLTLEGEFIKDFQLKDQIRRSSGSVMDNISEGYERGGNKVFVNFFIMQKDLAGNPFSMLEGFRL